MTEAQQTKEVGGKIEQILKRELTEEELALIPAFVEDMISLALNNGEMDKEAVKDYLDLIYNLTEEKCQKIYYVDSPLQVQQKLNSITEILFKNKWDGESSVYEAIKDDYESFKLPEKYDMEYFYISYYSDIGNCSWVSFYKYFEKIGVLDFDLFRNYSDLLFKANIYQFAKVQDISIVCRKFTDIQRDDQGRLHNLTGPAVTWSDGMKMYFIKGVEIPDRWTVTDGVTIDDIKEAQNAEIRRIALEIYGLQNYMDVIGAKKVASDEYGDLYRAEFEDDESLVMVSMLNSSPEPVSENIMGLEERLEFRETEMSGNPGQMYKRYMVRVPPDIETPVAALAWMADMTVDEYKKSLIEES